MDDEVGVLDDPLDAVLGEDDGHAEVMDEAGDGREHLLGSGRVEGGGGFVEDEDLRVGGQHRADGHALLLASGQLPERGVAQLGDAEEVQGLLDPPAHDVAREGELLHSVGELLLDRVRDEPGERVLPHHADQAGQVAGAMGRGVPAEEADPAVEPAAGEVRDRAVDEPEQRRLPRPGATDDEGELALVDLEVDVEQSGAGGAGIRHGGTLDDDGRVRHDPPRRGSVPGLVTERGSGRAPHRRPVEAPGRVAPAGRG